MHGGASTGPRTAEGRERVGRATRARWVAWALADGWAVVSTESRMDVMALLASKGGSRNATANALGLTASGLRRVLVGLPSRPEEVARVEFWGRCR